MMDWELIEAKTFSENFKTHKRDGEFTHALDKKMQRLRQDPDSVGGFLAGRLHGYKSTRIIRKYRLIFKIDEERHMVILMAIDHRKNDYLNFTFSDDDETG
jgi:mRNA-degrading endonuclease RelE of RelBE toxin-antitoxin system